MFDTSVVSSETTMQVWTDSERSPGGQEPAEWQLVDRRLRSYAGQRAALDAAESFDLVRAHTMKLHCFYGCSTFLEYMERRLGYAPHTGRERLRVARALVTLPFTAKALAEGKLTYSHVRELSRVATPETEEEWIAAADGKISSEVQELVSRHAQGDLPTDPERPDLRPVTLRIEVPTDVFALFRDARRALAEERGGEVTDAELVEAMCRRLLDPGTGADGPAYQIALKQCTNCKRATVSGAGRLFDVSRSLIERARCDAHDLGDLDAARPARVTTTVTQRMRTQIFARDNGRCCVPGCRASRNLCIHHLIPQAEGGPHEMWNLVLLCSGHHAALHDGLLSITGRAPWNLVFRWKYGPPLPIGGTAEEREAARREKLAHVFGERIEPSEPEIPDRLPKGKSLRKLAQDVPAGTWPPPPRDEA